MQLDRIKSKLEKALRKDTAFSVFGASSHKYKVNEKLRAKELTEWQEKIRSHFRSLIRSF